MATPHPNGSPRLLPGARCLRHVRKVLIRNLTHYAHGAGGLQPSTAALPTTHATIRRYNETTGPALPEVSVPQSPFATPRPLTEPGVSPTVAWKEPGGKSTRNPRLTETALSKRKSVFMDLPTGSPKGSIDEVPDFGARKVHTQEDLEGLDAKPPMVTTDKFSLSTNPSWPIDAMPLRDECRAAKSFLLTVYGSYREGRTERVVEWRIDLSSLVFVGLDLTSLRNCLVPNILFFELVDGYYMTPLGASAVGFEHVPPSPCAPVGSPKKAASSEQPFPPVKSIPTASKKKERFSFRDRRGDRRNASATSLESLDSSSALGRTTVPSYSSVQFSSIWGLKKSTVKAKSETERSVAQITAVVTGRQAGTERVLRLRARRRRIALIRQQIAALKEECAQLTHKCDPEGPQKELLTRARAVGKSQMALLASKQEMLKEEALHQSRLIYLQRFKSVVYYKKRENVNALSKIFGIEMSSEGIVMIGGIPLPPVELNAKEVTVSETLATALGYVTHCVVMISIYLECPLRYPLIPMGSRALVHDDVSPGVMTKNGGKVTVFPLYLTKGMERKLFDKAVTLLNHDITHLVHKQAAALEWAGKHREKHSVDVARNLVHLLSIAPKRHSMFEYPELEAKLRDAEVRPG